MSESFQCPTKLFARIIQTISKSVFEVRAYGSVLKRKVNWLIFDTEPRAPPTDINLCKCSVYFVLFPYRKISLKYNFISSLSYTENILAVCSHVVDFVVTP